MDNLLTISHDPVSLIQRCKDGALKSEVANLQDEISLTNEEMAGALQISTRAYVNYDDDEVLKPRIVERALALAQLYARGFEVMGKERFLRWMNKELIIFGNKKAKALLDTQFGIQILLNELGRIEYGVLA
jgi:uncharacterized protein (DUF2384 family)